MERVVTMVQRARRATNGNILVGRMNGSEDMIKSMSMVAGSVGYSCGESCYLR